MLETFFWIWVATGWGTMLLFAVLEAPQDGVRPTFWQQVTYVVGTTFLVVSLGWIGYIFLIGLKEFLPKVI